jgi:hypothetical protein
MNHTPASPISRRHLFASAAAANAGALAISQTLAQENNPATQVADRGSSIRLTRLTATPVGPKVYVKLETNHGIRLFASLRSTSAARVSGRLTLILRSVTYTIPVSL